MAGFTKRLLGAILVTIFAFYLIINALVPQLAGWASDLSCVNAVDYGWVVYLTFLVLVLSVVYAIIKLAGIGGM